MIFWGLPLKVNRGLRITYKGQETKNKGERAEARRKKKKQEERRERRNNRVRTRTMI